ncbi:MAG: hypothetical protein MUF21_04550 [Gemmatimonadaceae bacterium]|jgi:hypothetical protein|nr:hypothetical protein [Gemmatimonadaceae bacterium]
MPTTILAPDGTLAYSGEAPVSDAVRDALSLLDTDADEPNIRTHTGSIGVGAEYGVEQPVPPGYGSPSCVDGSGGSAPGYGVSVPVSGYGSSTPVPGYGVSSPTPGYGQAMPVGGAPPVPGPSGRGAPSVVPPVNRITHDARLPTVQIQPHSAMGDAGNRDLKRPTGDTLRTKFEVEVGAKLLRRGIHLDTATVRRDWDAKRANPPANSGTGQWIPGAAVMGTRLGSGQVIQRQARWDDSLIWVCVQWAREVVFFSHIGKLGRFHHSSFNGGMDVVCAGEWIVSDGNLQLFSANSGHYRPTITALQQAAFLLQPAFRPDTAVFVFDTQVDDFVDLPARAFIANGSHGGRYRSHPQSP